jgi:hypothetical protein
MDEKGLHRIQSAEQLEQFIKLWETIQTVQLNENCDSIVWNLTTAQRYLACSAYNSQFYSRINQPGLESAWHIHAEGKVKFFFWLLLRNWTADRLKDRGWPHDDVCSLCDQELESAQHLALHCPFSKEVWAKFQSSNPDAVQ